MLKWIELGLGYTASALYGVSGIIIFSCGVAVGFIINSYIARKTKQ